MADSHGQDEGGGPHQNPHQHPQEPHQTRGGGQPPPWGPSHGDPGLPGRDVARRGGLVRQERGGVRQDPPQGRGQGILFYFIKRKIRDNSHCKYTRYRQSKGYKSQ